MDLDFKELEDAQHETAPSTALHNDAILSELLAQ
jgi:hypothetical protein